MKEQLTIYKVATWDDGDGQVCVAYDGHHDRATLIGDVVARIARHGGYQPDEIDPAEIRCDLTVYGGDPSGEYLTLYGPLAHYCLDDSVCVVHAPEVENDRDFEDFGACRCASWCPGDGEDLDPVDPKPATVFVWET